MSDTVVKYIRGTSQSTNVLFTKYVTSTLHDTTQVYGSVDAQCHAVLNTRHNGSNVSDFHSLLTMPVTECRFALCNKSIMLITRNSK